MSAPNPIPASYDPDVVPVAAANGAVGHPDLVGHTDRLQRRLWSPRPGVWCYVGNGLSNQTFIEGPAGLIAIDSGECVEEMAAALRAVRAETSTPVVAVIYTHFHYVSGTRALFDAGVDESIPIWGHAGIVGNLQAYGIELSAVAGRGLVHQFGINLPAEGPDALVNVGLGLAYRTADHAPFTPGFVPPTDTFSEPVSIELAGLRVDMTPAPSDADDNITIWFPDLGVCVNNIVWPTLFNVFAIRGEEYRDPRVLLNGLDHIAGLGAEHLLGAHGPPLSGAEHIATEVTAYRDSIQFLWDQTVRGINRGLTTDELTSFVSLPDRFKGSYLTRQFYGLAEHHVRQIHAGLRGWFDGDETRFLPLPPADRCRRLIDGFGGADAVRAQAQAALDDLDLRWALELAGWLVHVEVDARGRADGGTPEDRALLAAVLRAVAQHTTASNIRNWSLTRALELEGALDNTRYRTHRIASHTVMTNHLAVSLHGLRVFVDPAAAGDRTVHAALSAGDETAGLLLRGGVAVPTDGVGAGLAAHTDKASWAAILAAKTTLSNELDAGSVTSDDPDALKAFFGCFDHPGLAA